MANTQVLIASEILTSNQATITFSSIPNTYTDLLLRISARCADTGTYGGLKLVFNSDSASNYSYTVLYSGGAGGASDRTASIANARVPFSITASDATANTFGNVEIYIPSYLASQNKPISSFGTSGTVGTSTYLGSSSNLWRNTNAITSIQISEIFATNLLSGSSFYLYGISNS